jgi:hypothetical protein
VSVAEVEFVGIVETAVAERAPTLRGSDTLFPFPPPLWGRVREGGSRECRT